MPRPPAESAARRRIVETADRLFSAHGLRAVGIDRVIAEAGVAKMTLYHHFPTKDDLIVAALEHRDAAVMAYFRAAVEPVPPAGRLDALFDALKTWFASPDFRGCAFANAIAALADPAHPGHGYARDHKRRFRALIDPVVTAAGGSAAAAEGTYLLIEGAVTAALLTGSAASADAARYAAKALAGGSRA